MVDLIKGALSKVGNQVMNNLTGDAFAFRNPKSYSFGDEGTGSGGQLVKAKLVIIDPKAKPGQKGKEFLLQYNPQKVTIEKGVKYTKVADGGYDVPNKQFVGGNARIVDFDEIIFDTFEERKSVWEKYVQPLETLLHIEETIHRPFQIMLVWGNFLKQPGASGNPQAMDSIQCQVVSMKTTYTLFLEDGTPVRARMKLTLEEVGNKAEKKSPDHAKVCVVRRGDTLQQIAFREYDDPGEWRRIARTNNIDDPLRLAPGTRLLIPPILK
jgi:hypothetical protein